MEQILGGGNWYWSGAHILGVEGLHCFLEGILCIEERHCSVERILVLGEYRSFVHILGFEECLCLHCVLDGAYAWSSQSASQSLELLRDQ